jgi:hypothetical protein
MKKLLLLLLPMMMFWQFTEAQSLEAYEEATPIMGKYFSVKNGEKHAVADATGKIISEWVDAVIPIDGHYTQLVKVDGRNKACAIMSESGKMLTGYDFAWVYTMDSEGLVPVKVNQGWYDRKLKLVGDNLYVVGDKSEGMYAITDHKTKKMGVLSETGKIIVTPKYDEVGDFHEGMCRVWILEKGYGFINTSGTLVVPCKYQQVYDFGAIEGLSKKYTVVYDQWGNAFYIDKKGKRVSEEKVARDSYDSQRSNSWY